MTWMIFLLTIFACRLPGTTLQAPTSTATQAVALPTSSSPTPPVSPAATSTPHASPTPKPASHRIAVRRNYGIASFYDLQGGEAFIPRGVNYFYLLLDQGVYEDRVFGGIGFDANRVGADFARLHEAGYNTVRIFFDLCQPGPECIVTGAEAGLNPRYLDSITAVLLLAKQNGLFLLLASNDLPGESSYAMLANQGSGKDFAAYRNAYFLTPQGIEAARQYWGDLLAGLAARDAAFDALLGWEMLNEQWYFADRPPFSLQSGRVKPANGVTYDLADPLQKQAMAVDGLLYYIDQVRQVILTYDPTALVSMGFFAPAYPNEYRPGDFRYVETAPLLERAELDFFDFHLYPGGTLDLEQLTENFGVTSYYAKPVLMGETGAFTALYPQPEGAARHLQDWIAASCALGFDGWLYWGYYRAPAELGDATWGFTDGDGLMMKALSPALQPDTCVTTTLRGDNLALGKAVSASASLTDEPPEAAVDGSPARWGSGGDAPQWIEIDLGTPASIGKIVLTVDQWPDGETVHQVWVGGVGEELRLVHEFRGLTRHGEVLEFAPATPLQGIQFVRIVTAESPSWVAWVEIVILAP